ncbi:MAG: sugar phosphate isomerase/epimerase [Prolixibacteraceae bacterium]|jgi:sugar phosphate isomerase/epimerase|nr:sugar phosphate isomerase/epimerase [Prolixibacteraceae bacterium]MBT6764130.1 sugar phosphate isomerase/epimerase [Prolixibacteraceae bacterium]MBT6998999.1 sugar phosphate isomerase/epimerase [Prolixibacteraceae bacterium]MBT7394502.1 sugar phosphate isomerase/epimerase [Prolixibacteraceae bacterium]
MNKPKSRRKFLKTLVAAPAVAALTTSPFFSLSAVNAKNTFSHKFKTSLNIYSFNSLLREGKIDLFDVLDFCAEYNFDAIDPTGYYFPGYPEVPSDDFIRKFKKQAFLLGLDISGTGIRNDFTVPDAASRKADIEMIRQWVIAAAKMGIPNIRVFAGKTKHEGFTRDQVFEWMAKDVKTCCDIGKEYGVIIAIQNHNDFLKTAADVDRIFEMVDSEWLGLNLDVGSYRQHDPYKEIEKNIKYAVTWQIKENVWIDGKETPTDLVKLFKIIKKGGYRGYLPIETLGAGDPYKKVPVMLEKIHQAMDKI